MVDDVSYLRIADSYSTTLVSALSLNDTSIAVANVALLATPSVSSNTPGVIFIDADTKTLVQALQEDGLAPTDNVKIEVKNGKISVNGTALTDTQNEKYAAYLKKK